MGSKKLPWVYCSSPAQSEHHRSAGQIAGCTSGLEGKELFLSSKDKSQSWVMLGVEKGKASQEQQVRALEEHNTQVYLIRVTENWIFTWLPDLYFLNKIMACVMDKCLPWLIELPTNIWFKMFTIYFLSLWWSCNSAFYLNLMSFNAYANGFAT